MPGGAPRLTVADTLTRAAAAWPDATAIVLGADRLTYRETLARGLECAAALRDAGLERGDHVGLLLPNCLEYLLLFYGCALSGLRPVHLNARYKVADLAYVIADSDMRVLITSARSPERADYPSMLRALYPELDGWNGRDALQAAAAPRLERVYCLHAPRPFSWPGLPQLLAGAAAAPVALETDPEQIALIMYTSGTTAHPKAYLLSHRALETAGRGLAERFRMTGTDRFWDPLPFFHMSTMLPLAACRATGAAFVGSEHFDAAMAVREIVAERATILYPSFPTITNALFAHPEFDPARLESVRLVNNVGPPDLLRRYASFLPRAVHVSAYGLTEAGGVIAFNDLDDTPEQLAETCGSPFAGIEVRIADPETGATLPDGERGEILIRGPTLFSGYYRDEQKTRDAFTSDGWLRSGDLGALAAGGRIRYLGRHKDMLKVGGENVAAIEIESHLCTHPAIKAAQVIGVPDERLQEVPAAFIERHAGAALESLDVVRHCLGRIAGFKVPRYVYFVDEWPLSATKIQKFRLRERVHAADRIDLAQVRRA
jgi:acyl-CoA synthetase (AMP-forming)/AMP-acid ligase II